MKKRNIIIGVIVIVLVVIIVLLLSRGKSNDVNISIDYAGKAEEKAPSIDVVPLLDENGITNSKYLDFKISSTVDTKRIYYEVIISPKSSNTINTSSLKMLLTDQSDKRITGVMSYNDLSNKEDVTGKILYRGLVSLNSDKTSKNETKDFRLRMWLTNDYSGPLTSALEFDLFLNAYYVDNSFVIDASAPLSLSSTSGNVLTKESISVDIITEGDGAINCKSSDDTVAICNVLDKKLTINGIKEGTAKIDIEETIGSIYSKPSMTTFDVVVKSSKSPTELSLSEKSGSAYLEMISEVMISTNGDGDLSCSSSDIGVATCLIDGKTLKINGVSSGTATITVSQEEGDTTLAANDAVYTVNTVRTPAAVTINSLQGLERVAYGKVYSGSNPNNYIWFNNEQWRILGTYGDNLKIVRMAPYACDQVYNNSGNSWDGSSIQNYLEDNYDSIISDETSKKMVLENATWYVGATIPKTVVSSAYLDATKTEWKGNIGLITSYEYQYAASKSCWFEKGNNYKTKCGNDDWLSNNIISGSTGAWTMSPNLNNSNVLSIHSQKYVASNSVDSTLCVSPVVYLKKQISVISGSGRIGEQDSYKLGL